MPDTEPLTAETITLTRDQISMLAAGETVDGYRMVAEEDTGEEWRHGARLLLVVTADGVTFWAIERRVPTYEPGEWDCRDQHGPELTLHRVVLVQVVKNVYQRVAVAS